MKTVLDEGFCFGRHLNSSSSQQQQQRVALKIARAAAQERAACDKLVARTERQPAPAAAAAAAAAKRLSGETLPAAMDSLSAGRLVSQQAAAATAAPVQQDNSTRGVGLFQARAASSASLKANQESSQNNPNKNSSKFSATPKIFPNNTLVEDLSKCHNNLWPKAARATSKTIELVKFCLPTRRKLAATQRRAPTASVEDGRRHAVSTPSPHFDPVANFEAEHASNRLAPSPASAAKKLPAANKRALKRFKFPMPESILRLNSSVSIISILILICSAAVIIIIVGLLAKAN